MVPMITLYHTYGTMVLSPCCRSKLIYGYCKVLALSGAVVARGHWHTTEGSGNNKSSRSE